MMSKKTENLKNSEFSHIPGFYELKSKFKRKQDSNEKSSINIMKIIRSALDSLLASTPSKSTNELLEVSPDQFFVFPDESADINLRHFIQLNKFLSDTFGISSDQEWHFLFFHFWFKHWSLEVIKNAIQLKLAK